MKFVLSVLMCVTLIHGFIPRAYAKHGGPDASSSGGAGLDVIGTYSGVLIPTGEVGTNTSAGRLNSVGLFSFSAPAAGSSTGRFTFFANGEVFAGTITAITDPDNKTVTGFLEGSTTLISPTGSTYEGDALGFINALISPTNSSSIANAGSSARLNGFAHVDLYLGLSISGSFDFVVDGFKQSNTTTAVTLPTTTPANGATTIP
jgi:hypothetical protein